MINSGSQPAGMLSHAWLFLIALLAGCSGDTVVEEPGEWSLGPELVVIGRDEQQPGHVLHNVVGAAWQSDGSIALADGSTGEIRWFDAGGRLLRSSGGLGSGPGAFRMLSRLWRGEADTLIVHDAVLSRLSYRTGAGGVKDVPLESRLVVHGISNAGIVAMRPPEPSDQPPGAMFLDSVAILKLGGPMFDSATVVHRQPWRTYLVLEAPTGQVLGMSHPLEPRGVVAVGRDEVYFGYPDAWRIWKYTPGVSALTEIQVRRSRRLLTADLRSMWEDAQVARAPAADRPAMRRYLASVPQPDSLPAYDMGIVDDEGNVWLREFTMPVEVSGLWHVVGTEGQMLGSLRLPSRARPLAISSDRIILHHAPEDAGEEVVLHELRR